MEPSQYIAERVSQFEAQVRLQRDLSTDLSPLEVPKVLQNAARLKEGFEALGAKLAETEEWHGKPAVNIYDAEFLTRFFRRERPHVFDDPYGFSIEMQRLATAASVSDSGRICGLNLSYLTGIRSLEGLPELTGLESIRLSGGYFQDLHVLSELPRLTQFILHQSQRGDFSALATCGHLQKLDLQNNRIEKIDFVSQLKNLRVLTLSYNPITDYAPLRGLPNVHSLSIDDFGRADLDPLLDLPELKQVTLICRQFGARSTSPVVAKLEAAGVTVLSS